MLVVLGSRRIAVELKYLPACFDGTVRGERFDLPNRDAHDLARHDFVKDVGRIERFVADDVADCGWAVALTNDSAYWWPGWTIDPIGADFRIHERQVLTGTRCWSERAGSGTTKKRDVPLALSGRYEWRWQDYSTARTDTGRSARFRHLAVRVDAGDAVAGPPDARA